MPSADEHRGWDAWAVLRLYREHYPPNPGQVEWGLPPSYPPATEAQLRQTEAELGFPLPADLRRLYTEVTNGGIDVGPVYEFFGAAGGFPCAHAWSMPRTIGQLVSRSGWRWHPRIEEALLRYPGRPVYAPAKPDGFVTVGDMGCGIALVVDGVTGRMYTSGGGWAPDGETGEVFHYEPDCTVAGRVVRVVAR